MPGFVFGIVIVFWRTGLMRGSKTFFFAFQEAVIIAGLRDLPLRGGLDAPGGGATFASFFGSAVALLGIVFPYLRMADAVAVARFGGLYIIIYVAAGVCR